MQRGSGELANLCRCCLVAAMAADIPITTCTAPERPRRAVGSWSSRTRTCCHRWLPVPRLGRLRGHRVSQRSEILPRRRVQSLAYLPVRPDASRSRRPRSPRPRSANRCSPPPPPGHPGPPGQIAAQPTPEPPPIRLPDPAPPLLARVDLERIERDLPSMQIQPTYHRHPGPPCSCTDAS